MKRKLSRRYYSATELANLVKPQWMRRQFNHHRESKTVKRARMRGINEHQRREKELQSLVGRSVHAQDQRCFIATSVYGENAWQTQTLRDWRDRCLMPTWIGRFFVHVYYKASPVMANWLANHPKTSRPFRFILNLWVKHIDQDGQSRKSS